jgi:hypothetical protein
MTQFAEQGGQLVGRHLAVSGGVDAAQQGDVDGHGRGLSNEAAV